MRSLSLVAIAAICAALAAPASAQEKGVSAPSLSASMGIDYSTGDYGAAEKTDVVLVPLILRARSGNLAFTTSVTHIRIEGPADVVLGPEGEPLPDVPSSGGIREGLSDLSLGAGYTFGGQGASGPQFALSGRIKLPTSKKSDQLSTGKVDYALRGEASLPFGSFTPFGSIGYRIFGDPEGVDLRNGVTASAGASVSLGRKILIASFDYASATSATSEDSRSIFGGFSIPVGARLNLTGYGVVGLSESSPNHGFGLLVTAQVM